jgi:hypothetical protein
MHSFRPTEARPKFDSGMLHELQELTRTRESVNAGPSRSARFSKQRAIRSKDALLYKVTYNAKELEERG